MTQSLSYDLTLECDDPCHAENRPMFEMFGGVTTNFPGFSKRHAIREARANGWKFVRPNRCYCKYHHVGPQPLHFVA